MLGKFENTDRRIKEPSLEPVDVLLLTLDAERYLERCLDSVYRELPVNKVITADGGSEDNTINILKKYPRTEIHIRPDIRTTGKCYEFLLNLSVTRWIIFMDADIELTHGWYDEMVNHQAEYDFFGSKRINHYEFERVESTSIDINTRPMGAPWLTKRECLKNYKVDDDYMWRVTDILLRQVVEKDGYKFGKVAATFHYHHTTDNSQYESDSEKRGSRLVFTEPVWEVLDKENWEKRQTDARKAMIKYIDPGFVYPYNDRGTLENLLKLDPEWVKQTSIKWYNALSNFQEKLKEKPKKTLKNRLGIFTSSWGILAKAIGDGFKASCKNAWEAFK